MEESDLAHSFRYSLVVWSHVLEQSITAVGLYDRVGDIYVTAN